MTLTPIRPDEGLEASLHQLKAFASTFGNDSEDLVQEALTRAIAHGVPVEAVPWLRTVTRRLAIDRARRAREVASGDSFDMHDLAVDGAAGPEDLVLSGERAQAVREALDALPPRYREALVAYANDGSASTVAKQMSLSSQATWTLLSRARDRLRRQLERVGFVPAAVVARFAPWSGSIGTGAVAAGCLVVALGGVASPPKQGAAQPKPIARVAAAAVVAAPVVSVPASETSRPHGSVAVLGTAAAVPGGPTTPARYDAEACTPSGDRIAKGGVRFEDDEQESFSGLVVHTLPSEARSLVVEGCRR